LSALWTEQKVKRVSKWKKYLLKSEIKPKIKRKTEQINWREIYSEGERDREKIKTEREGEGGWESLMN
jgi:hypothetical protein